MEMKECKSRLEHLSFTAAMNQRYHQHEWTVYQKLDKLIRISVGVVAVIGVVASLLSAAMANAYLDWISAIIAVIALAIAIGLNVYPSSEREVFHRDIFRRWSDLREDTDALILRLDGSNAQNATRDYTQRIEELTARKNRINSLEGAPKERLLENCYEAENRARTGYRNIEEMREAES